MKYLWYPVKIELITVNETSLQTIIPCYKTLLHTIIALLQH